MNCGEITDLLVDFLGGELVAEIHETVEVHIRGCAKCEVYVATYRHTVRVTRTLPKCDRPLSAAFEERLRQIIEAEMRESEEV